MLSREVDGDQVVLRIRYLFSGDLSSAVTAVLDPKKLTWVDESLHDLVRHVVRFELQPDHYADRLALPGHLPARVRSARPRRPRSASRRAT